MAQRKDAKNSASKQSSAGYDFSDLIELSQENTLAAYRAAVQTQQATGKLVQSLIDAGTATQEANLQAAGAYLGTLNRARQLWLDQASQVTERMLSLSPLAFEYPYRRDIEQFGAGVVESVRQALDTLAEPFKPSAR